MLGVDDSHVEEAITIIKKMSGTKRTTGLHTTNHGRELLPNCQYDGSDEYEGGRFHNLCYEC